MKEKALAILSLFTSTSTLLCCALPTLLVTLGLGAVVAGAVASLPWLVTLSQHKGWVFLGAGLLIAANWVLMWRWDRAVKACEVPIGASPVVSACQVASRFSRVVLWISAVRPGLVVSIATAGGFAAEAGFQEMRGWDAERLMKLFRELWPVRGTQL